jgi:hypothetical protein
VRGGHRLEVSATRRFLLLMIRGVRTPRLPAAGGASSTPALGTNFRILVQDPRTAVSRQTLASFETRICPAHNRLAATKIPGAQVFFRCTLRREVRSTMKWCLSQRDTALSRRDTVCFTPRHGLVAPRHGLLHAATRPCRAATRSASRRDTALSRCDTVCFTPRQGLVAPRHGRPPSASYLRHLRISLEINAHWCSVSLTCSNIRKERRTCPYRR